MKTFTDLVQSKKLAEILQIESADMMLYGIHKGMDGNYHLSGTNTENDIIPINKEQCNKIFNMTYSDIENQLPCWSLAALLYVIPNSSLHQVPDGWRCDCYDKNDNLLAMRYGNNPIDACYEMIIKLHEQKLL